MDDSPANPCVGINADPDWNPPLPTATKFRLASVATVASVMEESSGGFVAELPSDPPLPTATESRIAPMATVASVMEETSEGFVAELPSRENEAPVENGNVVVAMPSKSESSRPYLSDYAQKAASVATALADPPTDELHPAHRFEHRQGTIKRATITFGRGVVWDQRYDRDGQV